MEITEGHRRNIFTTLWLLDKALCEFRLWAEGRECKSVLYEEVNNLTHSQRADILRETEEIQGTLRVFQRELQLECQVHGAAGSIISQTTGLWINLVELGSKYLRGYGEPSQELTRFLEPKVRELLRRVQRISDIASQKAE